MSHETAHMNAPSNPNQSQHRTYQTMGPEYTTVYLGHPNFNGFDNKSIRQAFVAKVFSIVSVQLLFTSAIIALAIFHEPTKFHFLAYQTTYSIVAFVAALTTLLVLGCIESARRSFPLNFVLLSVLTLAYTILATITSCRYDTVTVLVAFGATAVSVIFLAMLAKSNLSDVTACGCALCVLAIFHLLVSIVLMLVLVPLGYAQTGAMVIAGLGAFLISLYLIYDLQLIMGNRQYELSPEEYIVGAVILYVDIVQLFQYLLILIGGARE